jgi:F-type H+-transporting ATPase subunit epsilon
MKTFELEIVTPEGAVYADKAVQLSVMAIDGSRSILANHIPLVTALKSAPCRIYVDDRTVKEGICSGGVLSVEKEKVRLLCTSFVFNT